MNRFINKIIPISLGATLCFGLGILNVNRNNNAKISEAIGNYSTSASTYYNEITASSGTQLAAQLHDLITSTHKYYTSYDDNGKNGYQKQTDQYYENGVAVSGYIYEFYSGVKWPNAWAANAGSTTGGYNREHCWCQSNSVNTAGTQMWGENGGGADMHHLRPVEVRLNSTRSNNVYGEISNRDSYKVYAKYGTNTTYAHGGYLSGGTFEPLDSKKGDVARIILYTYLHYNSYSVSTLFDNYGTTNGDGASSYFSSSLLSITKITNQSTEEKALELLLSWNESDPVDDIEQRRNEQVAIYQGNRNPFIDNSDYANMIWGSGESDTHRVNSVSVSPTSLNLDLNGTTTGNLSATVNVSNDAPTTVTWSSSNTNVATVSSSGVVTAVAKGSCSITATSTYNTSKSASCSVKVVDSSEGGGGTPSTDFELYSGSISEGDYVIYYNGKAMKNVVSSNRLGYLEVTPVDDVISNPDSSIIWSIASSGNYWTIYSEDSSQYAVSTGTKNQANVSTTLDDKAKWTVSGTSTYEFVNLNNSSSSINANLRNNGTYGFACYSTGTGGALSLYKRGESSGGSSATLTSISLNTSNVQTEFYVNDLFDYSGLVVTAHYDDGTEDIVNPTSVSSPDMSTAGNKTITVTYTENSVSKSNTYTISVIAQEITEIYASVSKTYYVGDIITSSDISVEDNLGNSVTNFTFANDNYQFQYSDASSGGSLTDKVFTNSISGAGKTCSLTVQVQRKARESVGTVNDTIDRDITGSTSSNTYASWSNKTVTSSAVYAGNSAGGNESIQLRSNNNNSGIVSTSSGGTLSKVTVTWSSSTTSGRTLNVYGKNTAYSAATDLYSTNNQGTLLGTIVYGKSTELTITDSYTFIGVRSNSGALYLTDITFTYGAEDTATNVANYIMYEDTNNQCVSKFPTVKGYFDDLSTSERQTFMSSNDYVISNARTRFQDWAKHLGKTIVYQDGDYVVSNSINISPVINTFIRNNSVIIVIVVSMLSVISIGGYFLFRKKKD